MKLKFRRQSPVKGGRQPLPSCVIKDISDQVDIIARRYRVSRSWVIATILGEALGIDEQISYRADPVKLRRVK